MSKHVFIIKEQLCQSFRQSVKAFRFEAKKGEGELFPLGKLNVSSNIFFEFVRLFLVFFKKLVEATSCLGVKTKRPTINPICV